MEENSFKQLSPKIIDNINESVYFNALDEAYKNIDINNIAITGAYAVGKSSIWKSYYECKIKNKLWEEKSVFHISLPNFDENFSFSNNNSQFNSENNKDGKSVENANNRYVEQQIFNQIAYQAIGCLPKYEISYIKLPSNNRLRWVFWLPIILFCLGISLLSIFFFTWKYFPFKILFNILLFSSSISLLFITTTWFLIYLIKLKKLKNFKFSIKGITADVENKDENANSILNKNLSEILYLILKSKIHTIVFEDLDRYNDTFLFNKLRNINFLLNSITNKKIRFIYIISDLLFNSNDRLKFFDFIIPIVPSISSTISYFKSNDYFSKEDAPTNRVLKISMLFVTDMRLFNNIINEYRIYIKEVKEKNSNSDINSKVFPLVALKNVFPMEFDLLQKNQGFIYECLNSNNEEFANLKNKSNEARYEFYRKIFSSVDFMYKFKFNKNDLFFKFMDTYFMNGFIKRDYWCYINVTKNNMINPNDLRFLASIYGDEKLPFKYALENPKGVILTLDDEDFKKNNVFNFDLFKQLIIEKQYKKINIFLNSIIEDSVVLHNFLNDLNQLKDYLEMKSIISGFIKYSENFWVKVFENPNFWRDIEFSPTMDKIAYWYLYVWYYERKNIIFSVSDSYITKMIEHFNKSKTIVSFLNLLELKQIDFLKNFEIKFQFADNVWKNTLVLSKDRALKIISDGLFDTSFSNIYELTNLAMNDMKFNSDEENTNANNYENFLQLIKDERLKNIYDLFYTNLNEYFSYFLKNAKTKIIRCYKDDFIKILNSNWDSYYYSSDKIKFVERVNIDAKITDLKVIKNTNIWEALLKNELVVSSIKNILSYWKFKNDIDQTLVEFAMKINDLKEWQIAPIDFIKQLIFKKNVNFEIFKILINILKDKNVIFKKLNFEEENPKDKILLILKTTMLANDEDNVAYVINILQEETIVPYLKKNKNLLLNAIRNHKIKDFKDNLLIKIIRSKIFDVEPIKNILQTINRDISIIELYTKTNDEILSYIVKKYFLYSDLSLFINNISTFKYWNDLLKNINNNDAKSLMLWLKNNANILNIEFCKKLLCENDILTSTIKFSIFMCIVQMKRFSYYEILACVNVFVDANDQKLLNRSKYFYINKFHNMDILNVLIDNHYLKKKEEKIYILSKQAMKNFIES